MKTAILTFLKTIGLKILVQWWENRGKDTAANLKDELMELVDARIELFEQDLKAHYGVRETAKDHLLIKDQVTGKVLKLYIADNHIKSELYEDKADK